jgi:hypothetical protein
MPYQASNFVTPPFAGYTSGQSTFSRATAEALAGKNAAARAFALFLGNWGGAANSGADFDGNGSVGPEDLALLLGQWN